MTIISSHRNPSRSYQRGFSLLELSIALAVIGIVVAGGLSMSTSMVDRQAYVQTGNQMDEIETALAAYVAVNDRLPCPADSTLSASDANFGNEVTPCTATGSGVTVGGAASNGALPVRTLGLRDRYAADEYGYRYTYSVTTDLTTPAGYDANPGAITVEDANDATILADAAYVVISHGGDGKGARRFETASANVACGASGLDVLNCDLSDDTFRDARFNRGSVAANWFDDTVRFTRKELLNLEAGGASGGSDTYWEANGNHIYNTNTENVGIGIANPTGGKLDILTATMSGTALNISGTGGSDNTGIDIDTTTTAINIDNTVYGVRVDVDSALGNAIYATTTEDNVILYRNQLSGQYNVGMHFELATDSTGIQLNLNGANTKGLSVSGAAEDQTGIDIELDNGGEDYWSSTAALLRGTVYHNQGNVQVALGTTQSGITVTTQETSGDFDATAATFTTRTNCGGGSDCYGLIASALTAAGANTGGAHFGIVGRGGVAGVQGESAGTGGTGVVGVSSAATGGGDGGYFTTASDVAGAHGVYGANIGGGTNQTAGVYGTSNSQNGYGVQGWASSATGSAMGVYGLSQAQSGRGVYGWAGHATGNNYGVYGQSSSSNGTGVYGATTVASVSAYGVRGVGDSTMGIGVRGEAGTYGVYGQGLANNAAGVYGHIAAGLTNAVAISGRNLADNGWAIYGYASGTGTTYGVYAHANSASGWGIWCQSAFRCGGNQVWTNVSDERLKKDIVALDDTHGLAAIRKLRPVTYHWKDVGQNNGTQIGFIAQEVEKVIPEMVVTAGDQEIDLGNGKKETITKTKAMGYAELTAPLVKAVQQLADKLDALWDSVQDLLNKVAGHDADIAALKLSNAKLKQENDLLKQRLDVIEKKLAN